MKTKIYLLWGLALAFLLPLGSCKPKESAYKQAYDAAKAREMDDNVGDFSTVTKSTYEDMQTDVAVQKEKVTPVDGAGIQRYSVVVGSFTIKTNADSLKDRMANQGYRSFLAQNARGMYRVIVATFSDKASAVTERNRVKDKYYPDFQDVWILDNQ